MKEIPQFWSEHFKKGNGKFVCGMYGVNIDESMKGDEFEYLIADNYNPLLRSSGWLYHKDNPQTHLGGFPCKGAMPKTIQDVNRKFPKNGFQTVEIVR